MKHKKVTKRRISSSFPFFQKGIPLQTSLSTRTSLLFIFGLIIFVVILILILYVSSNRLFLNWQKEETQSIHSYIEKNLTSLVEESEIHNHIISNTDITLILQDLPFTPTWLIIADNDYSLLYVYRQNQGGKQPMNFMRHIQENNAWIPIKNTAGSIILNYSLSMPQFVEQESNERLVTSFRISIFLACLVACFISLFIAQLFSHRIKKQTSFLVSSLGSIANGKRDLIIPQGFITEFNQIAKAADILQKDLAHEETLRRQWAQDIAHDLRTPLTVLQGNIEGIIDGVFSANEEKMKLLQTQVTHLSSLVNSLALLSKLETPNFTLLKQNIHLEEFIAQCLYQFSSQAGEKRISFTKEVLSGSVHADSLLFERLLNNLLSNAIEYSMNGSCISIYQELDEQKKIVKSLSIENPADLSEETASHMFDRLFQGKESRKENHSGLGLSIVKAICDAHDWQIRASYNSDKKTIIFTVFFTKSLSTMG